MLLGSLYDLKDLRAMLQYVGENREEIYCYVRKCLKLYIFYNIVFDLEIHFHDISAFSISDLTDPVGILDHAYVPRVAEMVHYFFAV